MKLILVRHGESVANVNKALYFSINDHDIKLTEKGQEQAAKAGSQIAADKNRGSTVAYISPYERTRATWQHMTSAGLEVEKVFESPALREQEHKVYANFGEYDAAKAEAKAFGRMWWRHENAESVADVYDRVMAFHTHILTKAQAPLAPSTVIVVAHEIVIRMYMYLLEGGRYEDYLDIPIENGSVKVYNV